MTVQAEILKQIDAVLSRYERLRRGAQYGDLSDQPAIDVTAVSALMCDSISRFSPPGSQYAESMRELLKSYGIDNGHIVSHIAGILSALRMAYDAGYLGTVTDLVHADIFSDFVEMAEYLLSEGYKDPAAVVIGSVLEEQLRQLTVKNGMSTSSNGKAKKADQLNADLAGKSVYSKLDQKSITSVVRHTDGLLLRLALARFTFSRMSLALAVQMNALG